MDGSTFKKIASQVAVAVAGGLVAVTLVGAGPVGAFTVPNNSVTSAKIVDDSILSVDIKNNTIQTIDIQDGTIQTGDIADNSVRSRDVLNESIEPIDLHPSARARWARVGVSANTSLVAGRGAVSARGGLLEPFWGGAYEVVFAYPVDHCGWTATIHTDGSGAPGDGFLVLRLAGPSTLWAYFRGNDGILVDMPNGSGFTVVVHC